MNRRAIAMRELLERVLPIERLPEDARAAIAAALSANDPAAIETAALDAVLRLEAHGILRFLNEVIQGETKFRRYRDLTTGNTLAVRLPITEEDEGVYKIPLPVQDWKGTTSLEPIRTLFSLYEKILTRDSQLLSSPGEILHQIEETAKTVLFAEAATFWSANAGRNPASPLEDLSTEPYDEDLAREWVLGRNHMVYFPDLPARIDPVSGRLDARFRSLVMIPLGDPDQEVRGVLHVWSESDHHFDRSRQGLLSLLSEVATDLFRRSEVLSHLVFVDAGTGVYNRAFFNLQLDNEIARASREGKSFALAIADIDDFRKFNSRYGYEGGNQVLATAANVLKIGLRPFDTVARWGGEEFAMILTPPVTPSHALQACERLRRAAELSRFTITGLDGESVSTQLTLSIGGAIYPQDGQTATGLWRAANAALVHAKQAGKNRVVFASDLPPDKEPSERRA